jgi:hypothetical protein
MKSFLALSVACGAVASAFVGPLPVPRASSSWTTPLRADNSPADGDEPPSLIVGGDEMVQQMQQFKSKYPTSESDYLAAARERAKARTPSKDRMATDDDWQAMADEKKQQFGEMDDWEDSKREAGNMDSQILMPLLPDEDGEGNGADDEPKLLLF